jgi:sugar lactone lactonase YvrE
MSGETKVLLDDLVFAEGPRWHDGRLWFSDMIAGQVMAMNEAGETETIAHIEAQPSGLGWLPDGRMLVVSMTDRRVLRLDGHDWVEHADISAIASWHCNDMVVDALGRAYVGNFGFDLHGSGSHQLADLALVEADGTARIAARELSFPNGTVITPDGKTLIVAETLAHRLTAFSIAPDGSLHDRRLFADLVDAAPDGICLDAEGCVWAASPTRREALRVCDGGQITDRIALLRPAFACMLGGADRRTLYICTASTSFPDKCRARRDGRVESIRVDVAGAGLP